MAPGAGSAQLSRGSVVRLERHAAVVRLVDDLLMLSRIEQRTGVPPAVVTFSTIPG